MTKKRFYRSLIWHHVDKEKPMVIPENCFLIVRNKKREYIIIENNDSSKYYEADEYAIIEGE